MMTDTDPACASNFSRKQYDKLRPTPVGVTTFLSAGRNSTRLAFTDQITVLQEAGLRIKVAASHGQVD